MNGLDNSGKTSLVTAARKTDLWNVKKMRVVGRRSAHYVHIQKFLALPHDIVTRVIITEYPVYASLRLLMTDGVIANCKRG